MLYDPSEKRANQIAEYMVSNGIHEIPIPLGYDDRLKVRAAYNRLLTAKIRDEDSIFLSDLISSRPGHSYEINILRVVEYLVRNDIKPNSDIIADFLEEKFNIILNRESHNLEQEIKLFAYFTPNQLEYAHTRYILSNNNINKNSALNFVRTRNSNHNVSYTWDLYQENLRMRANEQYNPFELIALQYPDNKKVFVPFEMNLEKFRVISVEDMGEIIYTRKYRANTLILDNEINETNINILKKNNEVVVVE